LETKQKWKKEQELLKQQLIQIDNFDWSLDGSNGTPLKYIGGVDISFVKESETDACACLVVLSWPDCQIITTKMEMVKLTEPYIPSFLAFREVTFLIKLINELKAEKPEILPQVIFVDGNGVLHPRGFGLASHLGVLSGIPTIGVGKTLFFVDGLDLKKIKAQFKTDCLTGGTYLPLVGTSGKVWGAAFKSTDTSTNPVFVSIGHKISLESAIELTKRSSKFRIPEAVRQADLRSREFIKNNT